ncbi:MAG: CRTAC1 family protein [Planctomycetes bacterium]|nr:CRTAC1 family protein [Planctomycetota bacterium]
MRPWNKRRRLLLQWSIVTILILGATIAWSLASRTPDEEAVLPGAQVEGLTSMLTREARGASIPIRFEDVTDRSGVRFRHFPAERASLLPEDMGSGVAVGDYDADGYPDLFFVNFSGNLLHEHPFDADDGSARLYRNVNGDHFEDVTDHAGLGLTGYGMGAAWGDFDNDGDLDLYVTTFGPNVLYENLGNGRFKDVTAQAGVQDGRFSAGCSWADYDRDGDLDLYVCNYVDFVYREADRDRIERQYATEQPYTLNPSAYRPQPNSLFRNNGDGTFEEVALSAGVADETGRSLSASWVDFDNDGWPDLYVANDVSNNGVFRNNRDGTFEDVGPGSLAADYRGAMGIAIADFDDDLDQDILVTHWIAQENALYRNMTLDNLVGASETDRVWFMDEADTYGLGQVSLDMVGWATGFCDFDNDGRRDLWLVNGSTLENTDDHRFLVGQTPLVFWNRSEEGFVDVTARASDALTTPIVGRGGAHVDYDQDGLVDWILVVHGGEAIVLKNISEPAGHWLRVKLRQTGGNTHAIGARAYVTAGDQTQMAAVGAGSSYLSQNELTLHFGLGNATAVTSLRIVWPDGAQETHKDLPVDRAVEFMHPSNYPGGPPSRSRP